MMARATLINGSAFVSVSSQKQHLNVPSAKDEPLRGAVEKCLLNYFAHLEDAQVTNLYNMVIAEVEAPLLAIVMNQVKSNQTKAADLLGLNRGTLRKKLKQYDLL